MLPLASLGSTACGAWMASVLTLRPCSLKKPRSIAMNSGAASAPGYSPIRRSVFSRPLAFEAPPVLLSELEHPVMTRVATSPIRAVRPSAPNLMSRLLRTGGDRRRSHPSAANSCAWSPDSGNYQYIYGNDDHNVRLG